MTIPEHSVLTGITELISFFDEYGNLADPTDVYMYVRRGPNSMPVRYTWSDGPAAADSPELATITRVDGAPTGKFKLQLIPLEDETGVWKYDWQAVGAVVWYGGSHFRAKPRQVVTT